jgi:hypothetical protein
VVDEHVVGVDLERRRRLADVRATDTGESSDPASIVTPATTMPSASFTSSGTAPPTAVSVACPSPSTTVPARLTSIVRSMS